MMDALKYLEELEQRAALGGGVLALVAWNMRAAASEARSVAVAAPARLEVERRAA